MEHRSRGVIKSWGCVVVLEYSRRCMGISAESAKRKAESGRRKGVQSWYTWVYFLEPLHWAFLLELVYHDIYRRNSHHVQVRAPDSQITSSQGLSRLCYCPNIFLACTPSFDTVSWGKHERSAQGLRVRRCHCTLHNQVT